MGFVLHLLLALASLIAVEQGWCVTDERLGLVVASTLVPYVLGGLARRAYLAGRFRIGTALERALGLAPVGLQLAALIGLGWAVTLGRWGLGPRAAGWGGAGLLAGLAPYLVFELLAIDARARCLSFVRESVGKARAFQVRMFLSVLLPFLLYMGGSILLERWPGLSVRIEEVGLLGALAGFVVLSGFLFLMPFFLRFAWDTTPLQPGWARTTLEEVRRRAGFRCRELLVWNTGRQMANAAIVGFGPRSRYVFFSDLLVAQLGPRELAAVFAHEMGHARRAHQVVFGAFALGFFLAGHLILSTLGIANPALEGGVVLAIFVGGYLAFGFLSRRFELEADLESLRVMGEGASLIRALEQVTGAHGQERHSWRHFSTRERIAFLERAQRDPVVGLKLRLSLERWRKTGFAVFLVAAVLELIHLGSHWNRDWVRADLRLGNYEEAADRARGGDPDDGWIELARLGAELPPDARDPVALEARARDSFRRGDREEARGYLELAILRGRADLEPVLGVLEDGDPAADPWGVLEPAP